MNGADKHLSDMDNSQETYSYGERFVAFLDIIGFRDIISQSTPPCPQISVEQILYALDLPKPAEEGKLIIGNVGDISKSGHKISQFSDSVIISTEPSNAGLLHLINHVEKIAFNFLKLGFLCRGGIAKGLLYHENKIAFGQAMLDAYDLEHDEAIYPRVIFHEKVEEHMLRMEGGEGTIIKRMIIKYQERYMVHILREFAFALSLPGKGGEWEKLYLLIKNHLNREIKRLKKLGKEKEQNNVTWFQKYFEETVYANEIKILEAVSK